MHEDSHGLSRRTWLHGGVCAAGALLAGPLPALAPAPARPPKAKSVIQIWLWGGACHVDTFDPKPDAGSDYTGPLTKPLSTKVPGLQVGELLPLLAKQADKYSVIRSLTHGNNGHETAAYLVQTGRKTGDNLVHPCVGAVVSLLKGAGAGYQGLVPPYIVLTQPQGRFSEAGYLGSRYKPFATGGNPAQDPFVVEGVVARGITAARQQSRRELLHELDTLGRALPDDPQARALRAAEERAYGLILGEEGKVFDLTQEPAALREAYGRTTLGQSCLLAARLVARGVPYVTINSQGWDTHKDHFPAMRRKLPELDKALATLLQDLSDRGLLQSTVVWCCGEFGRTPRVQYEAPWNGGRNHWGKVFSALVAGGGFKPGIVVGASDKKGEDVAQRPVHPVDLIGAIYELLGVDGKIMLPHPQGLQIPALAKEGGFGRLAELLP
ncbi:MAG: DUF1501 domain-containing protein [Planctomycetes bacterium]|nr:DUF1501 domain-containing protein [Planctomycetota bacterium]